MQHATVALLTEADYLAGETYSDIRHEYVDGYIYAMTGASKAHNTIAGNPVPHACGGEPARGFTRRRNWRAAFRPSRTKAGTTTRSRIGSRRSDRHWSGSVRSCGRRGRRCLVRSNS